jgi:phosphatidylinositol alpha-1,6-mannosyltransferase
MLLSVGRIIKRKGLLEFIERCMPDLVRRFPDLILVVIGDEPRQALKTEPPLVRRIESAIEQMHLSGHVLLLGSADEDTVQAAYQAADAFVFPLIDRPDDVEGFGIVAIEAASHGTPTIAFKCGGVEDAVVDRQTGFLVEASNYDEMTSTIANALINESKTTMSAGCVEFSKGLSWDRFGRELRTLVDNALSGTACP